MWRTSSAIAARAGFQSGALLVRAAAPIGKRRDDTTTSMRASCQCGRRMDGGQLVFEMDPSRWFVHDDPTLSWIGIRH